MSLDSIYAQIPSAYAPHEPPRAPKRQRPPRPRGRSFSGAPRAAGRAKHERIAELLEGLAEGLTVAEVGRALGMSRQLALYHLKRMAAHSQVVLVLEPCEQNGGVRFRAWSQLALAAHYSRVLLQTVRHAA